MSKEILSDDFKTGMILAQDVVNKFQQTIVKSGTVISEKHLALLKTWSVKSLVIQSKDASPAKKNEGASNVMVILKRNLKKRMQWEPRNEIEDDIYRLGLMYTAKKLQQNK